MNDKLFSLIKEKKIKQFKKLVTDHVTNNGSIDLNIRDTGNNHLLYYSIVMNDKDVVEFMIENGARIDITDEHNRSILFIPIRYGYNEIVELLLKYNKDLIGIDIKEIVDHNGNTPIFYTIVYKKLDLMKLLIEHNINVNVNNIKGLSPLHYSILVNSKDFLSSLINNGADVNNMSTVTGETALHLSINLKYDNLTKYLLQNNADPNIRDKEHKFAPIHYSVVKNPTTFSYLINADADINVQDIFGNTAFHYAIDNTFVDAFVLADIKKIDFTKSNNHHKLLAHKMLEIGKTDRYSSMFETVLLNSDMTYQDINGNTPLHLLFKTSEWRNVLPKLKKINLTIFNKEGDTPYDILKKDEDKEFVLTHVVKEFNKNQPYISKVSESVFTKEIKDKIIEIFSERYFNTVPDNWVQTLNSSKSCEELVKNIFLYFIKEKPQTKCFLKTYVSKFDTECIQLITNTKKINICTYTGSTLDIISGIVYLIKKYDKVIVPISENFRTNPKLIELYKSFGFKLNNNYEFLNFEIVWVNKTIVYPTNFDIAFTTALEYSKKSNVKFIAIPLGIEINSKNHANYLLFDIQKNVIERFEPNGASSPYNMDYDEDLLDDILLNKFEDIVPKIQYIRPKEYLPTIGFQQFDSLYKDTAIGDPGGFCTLWSLYYIEVRVLNSNRSRKSVISNIFKTMKTYNTYFKSVIRNYSGFITEIRDKLLQKANMDINSWINEKYDNTDELYKNIQSELFA